MRFFAKPSHRFRVIDKRLGRFARRFDLCSIHAHNLPFKILARELNRVGPRESGFLEGPQRSEVVLRRIGNYCTDPRSSKDDLFDKCADCNGSKTRACHCKLSNCEVDTGGGGFRLQLQCMLWIIGPKIPLNPPNWTSTIFDHENMCALGAINPWAVFPVNRRQIDGLTPPGSDVGGRQPLLKQRKVGSAQQSE